MRAAVENGAALGAEAVGEAGRLPALLPVEARDTRVPIGQEGGEMIIDLRAVRALLLLGAAILFFVGAGLGVDHYKKTVIVWGIGFGLLALDRLLSLLIGVRSA